MAKTPAFTSLIFRMPLRGVAEGDGKLGCLCGKAGNSPVCDGSAHSSGCVVYEAMAASKQTQVRRWLKLPI